MLSLLFFVLPGELPNSMSELQYLHNIPSLAYCERRCKEEGQFFRQLNNLIEDHPELGPLLDLVGRRETFWDTMTMVHDAPNFQRKLRLIKVARTVSPPGEWNGGKGH